jgi:hypothetical protein
MQPTATLIYFVILVVVNLGSLSDVKALKSKGNLDGAGRFGWLPPKQLSLPYCTLSTIFHGEWNYWEHTESLTQVTTLEGMVNASYERCPRTLSNLTRQTALSKQPTEYSCDPKAIKPAYFVPYNCSIMHQKEAASILHRLVDASNVPRPIKVVFLGDSLGAQLFVAFNCMLEAAQLSDLMEPKYEFESLFRRDIPCEVECTLPGEAGKRFREEQRGIF